jgi:hypothetical protein
MSNLMVEIGVGIGILFITYMGYSIGCKVGELIMLIEM